MDGTVICPMTKEMKDLDTCNMCPYLQSCNATDEEESEIKI